MLAPHLQTQGRNLQRWTVDTPSKVLTLDFVSAKNIFCCDWPRMRSRKSFLRTPTFQIFLTPTPPPASQKDTALWLTPNKKHSSTWSAAETQFFTTRNSGSPFLVSPVTSCWKQAEHVSIHDEYCEFDLGSGPRQETFEYEHPNRPAAAQHCFGFASCHSQKQTNLLKFYSFF